MTHAPATTSRHGLRDLWRLPGFRLILAIRLPSQAGDGAFQIGAAALVLFALAPDEATSAWEVARIIAVTAAPFTVVGPLAGVLIDRWRRQRILVVGQLVRVAAVLVGLPLASRFALDLDGGQTLFYGVVLVALGLNRFLLATVGAVTPRLVPADALVPANAIASTGGSIASLLGAAVGGGLAALVGDGDGGPEVAVLLSLALFAASALAAMRAHPEALGPDDVPAGLALGAASRDAWGEVVSGLRAMRRSRRAWAPILAFAVLRLATTAASIAGLLVYHNDFGGGSGAVAGVLVAFGVGVGIGAVVVTAVDRRRGGLRHEHALRLSLAASGAAILVFVPGLRPVALTAMSLALGVAFGVAKVATDTLIQTSLPDAYRGRVFTAYDVVTNVMVVAGGVVAALALPDTSRAEAVYVGAAVVMLATAALSRRWLGHLPPPVDTASWDAAEHALAGDPDPRRAEPGHA